MYSHLRRCECPCCLYYADGLRRRSLLLTAWDTCFCWCIYSKWGCAFLRLILFKSEAYSASAVGLCLRCWLVVGIFLSHIIDITDLYPQAIHTVYALSYDVNSFSLTYHKGLLLFYMHGLFILIFTVVHTVV